MLGTSAHSSLLLSTSSMPPIRLLLANQLQDRRPAIHNPRDFQQGMIYRGPVIMTDTKSYGPVVLN